MPELLDPHTNDWGNSSRKWAARFQKLNLDKGELFKRFEVRRWLGEGAMGVVYEAHDPQLGRSVALKLLVATSDAADVSGGRERLLREAQALARLNHPNVVAVHEAGTSGELVWLAMEFVEGKTLREWLTGSPRPWEVVLPILKDVGRGLVAAHAAGIVHRDLKPDNIMIGDDRRVRIADFGLATVLPGTGESAQSSLEGITETVPAAQRTMEHGAGTPAYMSPEQWRRRPADARADQYAFCVTLWETLFGERPFDGGPDQVRRYVLDGKPRIPARWSSVPAWLRRVVKRGLSVEASARFPSMEALLTALERGPRHAFLQRVALGALGTALAGGGVAAWYHHDRAQRVAACEAEGAAISGVWNEEVRLALKDALVATGVGSAATTYEKMVPWIERWTERWSARRTQTCIDATVDSAVAPDSYVLAAECLMERRDALASLLDVLMTADQAAVHRAVPAAASLAPVEACDTLDARPRADDSIELATTRGAVGELRRELMHVQALDSTGSLAEAVRRGEQVLAAAEELAYAPLVDDARVLLGKAARTSGQRERAEEVLLAAFTSAGEAASDGVAAAAAIQLVEVMNDAQTRVPEGLVWARAAEMLLGRPGQGNLPDEVALLQARAGLHEIRAEYAESLAVLRRAQALAEGALGAEHPMALHARLGSANVLYLQGARDEALAAHDSVIPAAIQTLGPRHPDIARAYLNKAVIYKAQGAYDQALAYYERARAIFEDAYGPEHAHVATCLNNMANAHQERGEVDQALDLHRRALAIREKALGEDHPDVAMSLHNIASIHYDRGTYDEAEALYGRALRIAEAAYGPDHPNVARVLNSLGDTHVARMEYAKAKPLFAQALKIREAKLAPDHPAIASTLLGSGVVARALGRTAEAVAFLERSLRIRESNKSGPIGLADVRFSLAEALWLAPPGAGRDRARAIRLASEARETYRVAGGSHVAQLDVVERWLRTRGSRR